MSVSSVSSLSNSLNLASNISSDDDLQEVEEKLKEAYKKKAQELAAKAQGTSTESEKTTLYKNLEQVSSDVSDNIAVLQNSLSSGNRESITENLTNFLSAYNAMVSYLSDVGTPECNAMLRSMKAEWESYETELKSIGISMQSSGTLTLDAETFEAAELDDIKNAYQQSDGWLSKVEKLSGAATKVASLKTSGYNALQVLYGNAGTFNESNLVASILDAFS